MVTPVKVLKKWSLFEGDKVIWMILFFLGMISIIEVYSASSNMSYKTGYYWKPILQHASYFVVGVLATILVHKIPCRYFKLIPLAGIPLSVFLLGIAMFTTKVNNASRWLEVGGIGFQPSEIAKGVLIATTAMILSSMRRGRGATSCFQVDYGRVGRNLFVDFARKLLYSRHDFSGHSGDDVHRRDTLETVRHLIGDYRYCWSQFVFIFAFCTGFYDRIHERLARPAPFADVGQSCAWAWEYTGECGGLRFD